MRKEMTRRTFIKSTGLMIAACAAPGGLVNVSRGLAADAATFKPHAFLEIAARAKRSSQYKISSSGG